MIEVKNPFGADHNHLPDEIVNKPVHSLRGKHLEAVEHNPLHPKAGSKI